MKESFFQFSDPELVNIKFETNEFFNEELFNGFSIDKNVSIIILDKEKQNRAKVSLTINIGDDNEKYPFYIKLTMAANFVCDMSRVNNFKELLELNAPAMLLSYARPIVSMITAQSAFPTLNLPFMNFKEN